ncbi:hypothetical protein BS78_K121800 [Paspalum vaginatum]|uniref:Uncharacterized protein n=1 Tax=Paspalum vaginatum TaxID=158149 RepID=A0A9W7X963_9POAL|nr:hypothetical protein BS78_K121800 [Paspalum vaginatum]
MVRRSYPLPRPRRPTARGTSPPLLLSAPSSRVPPDRDPAAMARTSPRSHRRRPGRRSTGGGGRGSRDMGAVRRGDGGSWLRPDGAVGRPREEGGRDLIPPLARGSTPCRTSPSPVQPSTSISQWQPIELPQSCNTSRRGHQ